MNDYEIALTLLRQGNSDPMRKSFCKDVPEVIDLIDERNELVEALQDEIADLEDKISNLED